MSEKNNIAISVKNVSKHFEPTVGSRSLKSIFTNLFKTKPIYSKQAYHALDNISFDIKKGDFFGIVGKNGSGKSTLLKMIAGVYTPNSGMIDVNGTLIPFIELGVGFNPELSGTDNVYLNGAMLGFSRKEMEVMYDDIVEFAELKDHMDVKLKNFSSGMQVRLAFAISVKAKSDIILFDEVLAVGDEAFQKKCMRIFEDYRRNKQTLVLVTHNMEMVQRLCNKALLINDGKIELIGDVQAVSKAYEKLNNGTIDNLAESKKNNKDENKKIPPVLKITGINRYYESEDTVNFKIKWPENLKVFKIGIAISDRNNSYIFGSNSKGLKIEDFSVDYSVSVVLGPGTYYITAALYDENGKIFSRDENCWTFKIREESRDDVGGLTRFKFKYKNLS